MEHSVRINVFWASAVLAIGVGASVVTSATVASRAFLAKAREQARSENDLTVKGLARRRVASDRASWRIVVGATGPTLQEAFAQLETGAGRVSEFLASRGFDDGEIELFPIETVPIYEVDANGRSTPEVRSYALTRAFVAKTADTLRVHLAAAEVTELIRENIRIESSPPEYVYSKIEDLKIAMAGEASANARERAEAIAAEAGSVVGAVRRASMGIVQVTAPDSTEVSDYGVYDTSTVEKEVRVVVTLTLAVSAAE